MRRSLFAACIAAISLAAAPSLADEVTFTETFDGGSNVGAWKFAFFDTFPPHDNPQFVGTWSNYPFFDSGTIAVSGIDEGLFLLRLQPEVAELARPPSEDAG